MRSRPSRTLLALTAAGALALAACGSDDDSSDSSVEPSEATVATVVTADSTAPSDTSTPVTTDARPDGTAPDVTAAEGPAAAGTDGTATDGTDGGDEGAGEADFVTAIGNNYAVFNDEAGNECVGQAIVDAVGFEAIQSAGIGPGDVIGIVFLSEVGLSIDPAAFESATAQLAGCGDLAAVALDGGAGTQEQTDCAAEVITSELAAEQLLTQIGELDPSPRLAAAIEALNACLEL